MTTTRRSKLLLSWSIAGCVFSSYKGNLLSRNVYTAVFIAISAAAAPTASASSFVARHHRLAWVGIADTATTRRISSLHPALRVVLQEKGSRRLYQTRKLGCIDNTPESRHRLVPHLSLSPFPPWVRHVGKTATTTSRSTTIGASSSSTPHENQQQQQLESSSEDIDDDDKNIARWEAMYNQGASSTLASASQSRLDGMDDLSSRNDKGVPANKGCSTVRLVTLDLDNTLWQTGATIDAANTALAEYLTTHCAVANDNNTTTTMMTNLPRVEKVMGELFRANRERYCPMLEVLALDQIVDQDQVTATTSSTKASSSSPVLLTQLRKDAILYVLQAMERGSGQVEEMGCTSNVAVVPTAAMLEVQELAFEAWVQARYASILSHLADSVIETLQRIKSLSTTGLEAGEENDPVVPVLVGAITDGNSNPLDIVQLAPYFDFCVNAESIGVLKPDRRVYLHALRVALQHDESLRRFVLARTAASTGTTDTTLVIDEMSDDQLAELAGPWWVHVGDDFVKDIVAAKDLGLRSIWARELVLDKLRERQQTAATASSKSSTQSVEDLVQLVAGKQVIEMQIGADDYLADSLQDEFADAVVDRFSDIAQVLEQWQKEAASSNKRNSAASRGTVTTNDSMQSNDVSSVEPHNVPGPSKVQPDAKFCVSCGTKLPTTAKFCSTCGEKQ